MTEINMPKDKKKKKKSSHIRSGLMLGAIIGVAAATFLQSKKGKVMKQDLQKKMNALQKKLNEELKKAKDMSKDGYEDLVDNVVSYYVKTKEIAKSEVPAVKKELMTSWKRVEKELTSSKKAVKGFAKSAKKKVTKKKVTKKKK